VVPWSLREISLGFFVTEDICECSILVRNSFVYLCSPDGDFSSFGLGGEDCFVGIVASDNDR